MEPTTRINENIFTKMNIFPKIRGKWREKPEIIKDSRKRRIAAGAGVKVEDVNRLLKSFEQMQKLIKQFSGPGAGKKLKRMSRGMGGFGGFPGF